MNIETYTETINDIINIASIIDINNLNKIIDDGRIDSAIKEKPFLEELKNNLLNIHPQWDIIITQPRSYCDIIINNLHINLKLTNCKTTDNCVNKKSIYYSITGNLDYPLSSNWNTFITYLDNAKQNNNIKFKRNRFTEYHYLVKNKLNGDVLLKSIFDINTYISNSSNDLQINWKKEFINKNENTKDEDYIFKVQNLLSTIQTSVKNMIMKTQKFADTDIELLMGENNI